MHPRTLRQWFVLRSLRLLTANGQSGSEGALMASFRGSLHFLAGSGQVMPEPQDRKRSCKLSAPPPPRSCAPWTLQAAGGAPGPGGVEGEMQTHGLSRSSALLFRNRKRKFSRVLFPEESGPRLGSYLVVGDRFLLSQWTASKKAAFQNLSVCLRDRDTRQCSPGEGERQLLAQLRDEEAVSCHIWEAGLREHVHAPSPHIRCLPGFQPSIESTSAHLSPGGKVLQGKCWREGEAELVMLQPSGHS